MGPENKNKPWTLDDLVIVANTLPTKNNVKLLAKSLKRSEGAIWSQWYSIYLAPNYVKKKIRDGEEFYAKVLKAKEIVGIGVSITPKS